jgi:hypothetical protein
MENSELGDTNDLVWSRKIADLVIDTLVRTKIVATADIERAAALAAEELYVRLALQDRPTVHARALD